MIIKNDIEHETIIYLIRFIPIWKAVGCLTLIVVFHQYFSIDKIITLEANMNTVNTISMLELNKLIKLFVLADSI